MPRYIDAFKAKNEIRRRKAECDKRGDEFTLGIVDAAIDYVDSADVEEVKHGEWIVKGQDIFCSECGKESLYNPFGASVYSKRCPECGAIMDGKNAKN